MTSIKLFRGGFGHVSVLNVAGDLVTHAHPEAHIIIWLDGSAGSMTIGDATMTPGIRTAAAINAFEPHSHSFPVEGQPGVFLAFYIDPHWAWCRNDLPPGAPIFADVAISMDDWLRHAAANLFDRLCSDVVPDTVEQEIEGLIDSLIAAARIGCLSRSQTPVSDYRVRKAINLMKSNICERICFDEVARKVGMSRAHFFALFKEQTQLTPNVYWNMLRMEEARHQLQSSRDPLISVACNLGFTTQGNFSRFFRDHVGVPPIQYREAARGQL